MSHRIDRAEGILLHDDHAVDDLLRTRDETDPPARHTPGFGETAEGQGVFIEPAEIIGRSVPIVDKAVVYIVREDEYVPLPGNALDYCQLIPRVDRARGVIRAVDKDDLCPVRNGAPQLGLF